MHGFGNGHGPVAQHVDIAGHLPNNLTVEKIRAGNSNIRNPILVSFVSKGLLPYHLGSGIKRALDKWPEIDFSDDHDGCLFTATVHRKPLEDLNLVGKLHKTPVKKLVKTPVKKPGLVLMTLKATPYLTLAEVAETVGKYLSAVERAAANLVRTGKLKYEGRKKGGHWEVIDK